jgi:ferritin
VDITQVDVSYLEKIDISKIGNKVDGIFKCTEAQYHYSQAIRKVKMKKELVPSSASELHQYAMLDAGEYGTKFLEWVIKQPACDKGTALSIYWKGQPAEKDSGDGIYQLLKKIEKRVKQNFYQTTLYPFDYEEYKIIRPAVAMMPTALPTYMFKT